MSKVWAAWRTWSHYTEQLKMLEMKRKFATSLSAEQLSHLSEVDRLKHQLAEQKRKRADALIQKWRTGAMIPCFKEWQAWAKVQRQRKTDLMDKCFRRLAMSQLYASWRTWTGVVHKYRLIELGVGKAVAVDELRSTLGAVEARALAQKERLQANIIGVWQSNKVCLVGCWFVL
jgi:hypothetical protein